MNKALVVTFALALAFATPMLAEDRQVVTKVPPQYPAAAKQLRITGTVKIAAEVDADGNVSNAKALSGNLILTKAAVDAILKWKYKPGPKTTVTVELTFTN